MSKPNTFLTNSQCIADALDRKCQTDRRHIALQGSARTKVAQVYPPELSKARCRGIVRQKQNDARGVFTLVGRDGLKYINQKEATRRSEELHVSGGWIPAWNDVSGKDTRRFPSMSASGQRASNTLACDG